MKARTVFMVLILIIAFSMTVPAFADPGTPNWEPPAYGKYEDMGEWASEWKLFVPWYMMYHPNPGQGNANGYKWGPVWGYLMGHCEVCAK